MRLIFLTKINKTYIMKNSKTQKEIFMNKIVAVVGMCGSGKSVAVEEFEKRGYQKVYFGAATFELLQKKGLEITPENEKMAREELRASGDKGIYAKIFLPKIEELFAKGNVVIESMYSWSEYKYIKEKFSDAFSVLAIITNTPLRRERLRNRDYRPLTNEESLARDYAEIENIEKGGPIVIADYNILNNTTKEDFLSAVNDYLDSIE